MSPALEFIESREPLVRSARNRSEGGVQSIDGFIQVFPGNRLSTPVVGDLADRLTEQKNRIGNSGERLRPKQRTSENLMAGLAERDEVAGEVATVDRGYVFGIEWTQVPRIIPV